MTYKALHDGRETTARKYKGRWMIGGDFDTSGSVLILMDRDGRPAWYKLKGCVLKFSDFA